MGGRREPPQTSLGATQDEKDLSTVQLIRKRLLDANNRFEERDRTIAFNLSFCLELEHYLQDNSPTERSLARIKPREPGLFRIWRYKTALELKRFPMHVDAQPLDEWATDQDLQDAERAVEAQLTSRLKRYEMTRRRYVGGKNAAGAWAAELCFDGAGGLYAESLDPRYLRWADGYLEPHAAKCPWVMTVRRMPISECRKRKGWKVPEDLQGDRAHLTDEGQWSTPQLDSNGKPLTGGRSGEKLVTVVTYRCRFEDYGKAKEPTPTPLDPGMHHLSCPNCGWKSPPQAESMQPYSSYVPQGCPTCGGDVGLVKATYAESKGKDKLMVICAPFSGHEEPFYEGPWDFDYPSFPVLYVESYVMPHRSGGQSDTQVLKTPVLASNATLRLSYETALGSKPKWFVHQRGSIENAQGAVFGFDPYVDGDVMYGTSETPRIPEIIQGQGINPSIFALYDRLQSAFRTNESTSELALSPSEIKSAKVGTVEQVTETGNVVIDDHGAILYDAESVFTTCMAFALRELPSERQRHQNELGVWEFRNLGGPLMPRVEIRIGSGRLLDALDKDELEAYTTLVQMPPERREGFAYFAHLPPEVMGRIRADDAKAQQAAMQQMQMGMPPPGGPMNPGMGGGGAPRNPSPMMNGGMQR